MMVLIGENSFNTDCELILPDTRIQIPFLVFARASRRSELAFHPITDLVIRIGDQINLF